MKNIALMYHDIIRHDYSESGFQNTTALKYKVNANEFERHVTAIARFLQSKCLPNERVEFTFDDGGVSFLTEAAPILERYGFRGKFFIATSRIDTEGFLTKEQIVELQRRGHIIGAHSHTHPERMSSLSQQQIEEEWGVSVKILEDILKEKPICASIPNGYSSGNVIEAMKRAGITEIHTSQPTVHFRQSGSTIIKGRYAITEMDSVEAVMKIVSSRFTRMTKATRFKCLAIAKALLGESYLKIRRKLLKK